MPPVRFFAPDTDAYVDSVQRHAAEFTEKTGLDVEFRIIPSDTYFSNEIQPFLDGDERADVYMSGPVLLWDHIRDGFVEPLDPFLPDRGSGIRHRRTSSHRFSRATAGPESSATAWATGTLWEIPVNCETYNLACIPAALERHGCDVPETWDSYFATAATLTERSKGATRGFAQRGTQVWHTMYTGYATQFWAFGARDFDDQGRCAIASPQGVAATRPSSRHCAGPARRTGSNQRWYELAMDFAAGRYGLIVDSDHYVAFYEMGENSAVKGKVGYCASPGRARRGSGNRTCGRGPS